MQPIKWLLFLMLSTQAFAQPAQFASLLTNSTDYTTNTAVFQPTTAITAYSITTNVVTFSATNTFSIGTVVYVGQFPIASNYLNGLTLTLTAATGSTFSAAFTHADVTSTTAAGSASLWIPPAFGACSTDTTWGTAACRLPLPTDCPVLTYGNPSGVCSSNKFGWNNDYSKVTPFSTDMNYYMLIDPVGWLYLYHNTGTYSAPVWVFVRRLQTGSVYTNRDYNDGAGLYGDESNWIWSKLAGTHLVYYTGSSAGNVQQTQLKVYNPDTDTITVVHDFTATIALYTGGLRINNEREGNPSEDDKFWAFTVNDSRGDNGSIAAIVYNKTTDTLLSMTTAAGGLCGANACATINGGLGTANWIGMSPSGTYVIVNWNCYSHNSSWGRGCGTESYLTSTLAFHSVLEAKNGHADVTYDVNGAEVYVSVPDDLFGGGWQYNQLMLADLSIATSVVGSTASGGSQRVVSLPCSYNNTSACPAGTTYRGKSYTISGRATRGTGKGYILFSMYDGGNTNAGVGGFGANENLAVKMDFSAAYTGIGDGTPGVNATYYRLSRSHGIGATPSIYTAQPDGVPNIDFTAFAYTSNGDMNNQPDVNGTPSAPFINLYTVLSSASVPNAYVITGKTIGAVTY